MNTQPSIIGKPNIIITGGAGFLGSNMAESLIQTSHVIVIDNFITGSQKNIDVLLQNPNFEFLKHDITQPIDLQKFPELKKFKINAHGIQAIYHFACPTSPRDHEKLAMEIIAANSLGIKNMLDLANQYKAIFLHISSQHIYGSSSANLPIKEDYMGKVDPIGPRSAYDEGKRFAETIVSYYQRQFNLNAKIARLFTCYGPKMAINDGRSIPDFIFNALNNKDMVIYGDEKTENTFCYVLDAIDGLLKLKKSSLSGPVNIGHYEKIPLKNIAELIINLTQSSSKIIYQKPEWHVASYNIPDISLAKEKLGWFPMFDLETGLKRTIEYMKANLRAYTV
ncbi:MAG: NAD-dependent epimerase/dehydratase family protein [Candidatus Kuenenbacteria bacterium]